MLGGRSGVKLRVAARHQRRPAMTTLRAPDRPVAETQTEAVLGTMADGRASPREAARAFGVVVGPSVVLDALVAGGGASALRAMRAHRHPRRAAALATTLAGAYATVGRPLMLHWGATCADLRKPLPGDEIVPGHTVQSTRAVTIEAPVDAVWPWLAQIGQDRAGFYSYEALENLAGCEMRNADAIHPEWQWRARGETVFLHRLYGLRVERFEPGRTIVLAGWGAFVLDALGPDRTRLIARSRAARGPAGLVGALLIEIPHFVMERKMLLGIKERAERHHTASKRRAAQAGVLAGAAHA